MKPQDGIFFITLLVLLYFRKPAFLIWAAIISLIIAIPLFATWTFFTAERLTWYAVGFVLIFLLLSFLPKSSKR